MRSSNRFVAMVTLVGSLAVCACGDDDESSSAPDTDLTATVGDDAADGAADDAADPVEDVFATDGECELLDPADVDPILGPNDGGAGDPLHGGCAWTSVETNADSGLQDRIAVAIWDDMQYGQQDLSDYEPADDFVPGALRSGGALFWPCGDRHCLVDVLISGYDDVEQAATTLASTVRDNL